jgi:type IV pilus assembly protein PilB
MLQVTPRLRDAVAQQMATDRLRDLAVEEGMQTLRRAGLELVLNGVTSLKEMMAVV